MSRYNHIVVLTGAGLSAESGLHTFRDKDGIWARHDYREVATPEGYHRNPVLVLNFYNERRRQNAHAKPNAAHDALARLETEYPGQVLVVTFTCMARSKRRCAGACGRRHPIGHNDLTLETVCPTCTEAGYMRPDVVWFGEMPYDMERIYDALGACDLFLSIGTSGTVYPAAGFVLEARQGGAHTVELNLEPSEGISGFHRAIHGRATEVVPAYVEELLSAARGQVSFARQA